ncbi:hypothetical protein [Sinorhizobium psoraleae]|uniref:Uncharacterized protein n=1 Tax=Sinorhizobium psoraleae TaxID=520838 RepID=A0ABT4K9Q5_9HYPH|nr:hypothetical protein [Sinorhizobium psoraleae]MCZ4088685.1 hypothetical protein [Sinorhizobium psoraleae]
MPMINPPKESAPFDRQLDCEEALERRFHELTVAAEEAGWRRQDIGYALVSLSENYLGADSDDTEDSGPRRDGYCSNPSQIGTASLHPILYHALRDRQDFCDFEGYKAAVRYYPSRFPAGHIDFALNPKTGEVCAIHACRVIVGRELTKMEIRTTDPQWGTGKADGPRHAALVFYDALLKSGHLEHEIPDDHAFAGEYERDAS